MGSRVWQKRDATFCCAVTHAAEGRLACHSTRTSSRLCQKQPLVWPMRPFPKGIRICPAGMPFELTDPGCDFSVLRASRDHLLAGSAEALLLKKRLERCGMLGLRTARGQQRTDSTHVLAAIRVFNRLELVAWFAERPRATTRTSRFVALGPVCDIF